MIALADSYISQDCYSLPTCAVRIWSASVQLPGHHLASGACHMHDCCSLLTLLYQPQVLMELKSACAAVKPPSNSNATSLSAYKPAAVAVLSVIPADTSSPTGAGSSSSSSSASAAAAHVAAAAAAAASSGAKQHKQYGPDRLGVLRVEVYVFKQPGPNHRLIAENYSDWSVEAVHTGRHR